MSAARPVLFVDGPLRGRVEHVVSAPYYTEAEPVRLPATGPEQVSSPAMPQKRYTVHRFSFLGHMVLVGSVHGHPDDISNDDAWAFLVSAQAMAAEVTWEAGDAASWSPGQPGV